MILTKLISIRFRQGIFFSTSRISDIPYLSIMMRQSSGHPRSTTRWIMNCFIFSSSHWVISMSQNSDARYSFLPVDMDLKNICMVAFPVPYKTTAVFFKNFPYTFFVFGHYATASIRSVTNRSKHSVSLPFNSSISGVAIFTLSNIDNCARNLILSRNIEKLRGNAI